MREGLKDPISGTSQNDNSIQKYIVDSLLSIIYRVVLLFDKRAIWLRVSKRSVMGWYQ